jgi:transcriptional regulator with XRE-family HTH domain
MPNRLQWPVIFRALRGQVSTADMDSPTVDLTTAGLDPLLAACKKSLQDRGLSYRQIAEQMCKCGHEVQPGTIRAWLNGRRVPGLDAARLLCTLLEVPMGPDLPRRRRSARDLESTTDRIKRLRVFTSPPDPEPAPDVDLEETTRPLTRHQPRHGVRPDVVDGELTGAVQDATVVMPAPTQEGRPNVAH